MSSKIKAICGYLIFLMHLYHSFDLYHTTVMVNKDEYIFFGYHNYTI